MFLASRIIQDGREARRSGKSLEDNPFPCVARSDLYEAQGVPPNNWIARVHLGCYGLWETGWRIEDRYGN